MVLLHTYKKSIIPVLLLLMLVLSGCGGSKANLQGTPIEPIVPGEEKGEAQTLQGRFDIKSAEVQITGLSTTADGALVAVGTASRTVLLLERDGRLRWEKLFNTLPLQVYLEPAGRFLVVGTEGGRVHMYNLDQSLRFEQNLGSPVRLLSVAKDGELLLAGLFPEEDAPDKVVVLDRHGRKQAEIEVDVLLDVAVGGPDNMVLINWQDGEDLYLGAFSATGEELWREKDRNLLAVTANGRWLATSFEQQIFFYNSAGRQEWIYPAAGTVKKLIFSANGSYLGVLVRDDASHKEELIYLNTEGERLWSKRLPDESELLVSADGRRVVIASWRQYRDDATQIHVYNQRGQEINTLDVAGRVQRMALQMDTLVLGLEDGSIYFLNIAQTAHESTAVLSTENAEQEIHSFYHPVNFSREKDETLMMLFFFDEDAQALIPVTRRIKQAQQVIRAGIDELIRGPVQGSQLQRTIPKDAEIGVSLSEGLAVVDLPPALDEMGGSTFLMGIMDSLLLTVSQFPTVEEIRFVVGGQEQDTFGQEGLLIDEVFAPRRLTDTDGKRVIFLPYRAGSRYYLLPEAYNFLPLKEIPMIEALVLQIISEAGDFFPPGLRLRDVKLAGNTVTLDFNADFARLIPGEDAEAAARAALIRDAIALTIAENLSYSTVRFTIGGEPPKQLQGYLPWELTVSRPYYINQEE